MSIEAPPLSQRVQLPAPPGDSSDWKIYLYSHTHWDREWYQAFERFRMQLVGAVDTILHTLQEQPSYPCFTLDGQTVVLSDYLALRPERAPEIAAAVRNNRLEIGPWYVLPDEFLVSGESLIRNLHMGRHMARQFGRELQVGYLPDPFGHIAQMPQILHGFGIEAAVFSRGVGDELEGLGNEFWWASPDGTSLLAIVQGHPDGTGYSNAAMLAEADRSGDEQAIAVAIELAQYLAPLSRTNILMFGAGNDHETINPNLPELVRTLNDTFDNACVELVCMERIVREALEFVRDREKHGAAYATLGGELRGSRYTPILAGIFSARIPLKQDNVRLQSWLEHYVEPLSALVALQGIYVTPQPYLRRAWQLTLQNHPHDSIGGCSVDSVHQEMGVRTKKALDMCAGMVEELLIAARHDHDEAVFNPQPYPCGGRARRSDGSRLWIKELAPFAVAPIGDATSTQQHARVVDERSVQNEVLTVSVDDAGCVSLTLNEEQDGATFDNVLHFVDLADAGDEYDFGAVPDDAPVHAQFVSCSTAVEEGTGSAQLTLRHTMQLPAGLGPDRAHRAGELAPHELVTTLTVSDGQGWVDCRTEFDNRAMDHRLRVRVALGAHAEWSYADGQFAVMRRSTEVVRPLTVWKQDPATSHHCERFAAVEGDGRGLALLTRGLHEYEVVEYESGGSALELTLLRCVGWLSRDDIPGRPAHAGPGVETPGAQCLGPARLEYAIVPYRGTWQQRQLPRLARQFHAPPLVLEPISPVLAREPGHRARKADIERHSASGASFDQLADHGLSVQGCEVAALKLAEDGGGDVILRLYNPYEAPSAARITLPAHLENVVPVRLDEEPAGEGELRGFELGERTCELDMRPGQIRTLRLCSSSAG